MKRTSWLYSIAFRKGFWRRRWLIRPLAFLGVAALLLPLAQPLLRPPDAAPQAEAADLGWSDARPPLTEISDNVPPFRPLPAFGDVGHPMAVASNGDIFTAGGPTASDKPSTRVYKSVDGGKSWRSSGTPCGSIKSIRLSPDYAHPDYPDNTVVLLCHGKLAISRNAGLSWTDGPTMVDTNKGEGNTSFALSPDFRGDKGGVILVGTTGNPEAHTKWVTWDGKTGTFGPVMPMLDGPGVSSQDSALAVAFPPGFVGATLPEPTSGTPGVVAAAAWSKPRNISNNSNSDQEPDIAVDSDGTVHAVWQENVGNWEIFYATKAPGGAWSTPVNISNSGSNDSSPAIAVDPNGGVHVVWEQYYNYPYAPFYATKPKGGSWSAPTKLPGCYYGYEPDIAVDGSGVLHVVWREYCYNNDPVYVSKAPGSGWSGLTFLTQYANTSNPTVAAEKDGTVHMAWQGYTGNNWDIYHTTKPSGGSFYSPVNVSNNLGNSYRPSIAVGGGGMHVVWYDYTSSGYGEILYSMHSGTGGFTSPRIISNTASGYSELPSIAVDGQGRPPRAVGGLLLHRERVGYLLRCQASRGELVGPGKHIRELRPVLRAGYCGGRWICARGLAGLHPR